MQSQNNPVQESLDANLPTDTRRCSECGAEKSFDEFARKGSHRGPLGSVASRCKECVNRADRAKRALKRKKKSVEARFWSKVDKNGPVPAHCSQLGQCWIWTGGCFADGYGAFCVDSRNRPAHRVSYEIEYGPISCGPTGEPAVLLHACDNPACVRPAHLSVGTTLENVADRQVKGRTAHGEQMPQTKVNDGQKKEIRDLYALGTYTQAQIAAKFGIHQGSVSRILLLNQRETQSEVA
jgi:hypothetical protein